MIGALRGRLISSQAPNAVVDCGGVGYEVETPMSTFLGLPAVGEDVFLYTHMVVRENAHALYGFASMDEKHLFRTLLGVSGVLWSHSAPMPHPTAPSPQKWGWCEREVLLPRGSQLTY